MNLFVPDSLLGRQRCRQWTPLITQQVRLRHLYQIMVYNVSAASNSSFYFTLHLTPMCAPFYTSEKNSSINPKWAELDMDTLPFSSIYAFVLRIWRSRNDLDADEVITTWGINLSGLIYLGVKLSEIQPESFNENSVIFNVRGGFFTSCKSLRRDLKKPFLFIDNLNIISTELETKVFRNTVLKYAKSEIKHSYTINQLQKLHSLQITIKNQSMDVKVLRDKISVKCGLCDESSEETSTTITSEIVNNSVLRHESQLLTMTKLNKMLKGPVKPTKLQRLQITRVTKEIELLKFRTKLLSQERDKKSAYLRQLKQKCCMIMDENEERGSSLMENYRKLSRDSEKFAEWRKDQTQFKECFLQTLAQLQHRRHQLMNQILEIYPIQVSPSKCLINGIYLPDSEMLSDCADGGLAVALGYVSHILLMCSSFLQVPLRYPISFFGSRSHICNHITVGLQDRDRDFPLYAKGKDRMQFNYAVYLLNKNIAQFRWICGQNTPDLRATLPNLYSLLHGRENGGSTKVHLNKSLNNEAYSSDFVSNFDRTSSNLSDPILDTLRQQFRMDRSRSTSRNRKSQGGGGKSKDSRPGLSEILAVPEAFMNRQISHADFKSFISLDKLKRVNLDEGSSTSQSNLEIESTASTTSTLHTNRAPLGLFSPSLDSDAIEQGTDILQSSLNVTQEPLNITTNVNEGLFRMVSDQVIKMTNPRICRSEGSIIDEELNNSLELGSDPLINVSFDTNETNASSSTFSGSFDKGGQQEFLQKWLDSGPALVCSEENLYPDEILGTTATCARGSNNSPLTLRTDALLNTSSFNLIKPK